MTAKNLSFARRLRCALSGVLHGLRAERSLQTQAITLLVVVVALIILRPEPVWWALVGVASASVVAAELFNTAVENLADHLHPQLHPHIRIVKDCAAGAVLITALGALTVAGALIVHLLRRPPPL